MRRLLPAEKVIYEHWLINIVKPKKIKLKLEKPPEDFEPKYVYYGDYT